MEEDTALQPDSSPADRIKPWQFKKGQSGNPSGKPRGAVSLKTWARNYIQTLSDEERFEFLEGIDKKTVWEMAEGKADTKTEVNATVEVKPITGMKIVKDDNTAV